MIKTANAADKEQGAEAPCFYKEVTVMEIRLATPDHVPGILELLRQVGQVHYKGRPDIFRDNAQKYGPSQVLALLGKADTPVFVAVEDGKVLGYCFCQIKRVYRDTVLKDNVTCYIDDLCVDENCRGKGIGKKLYAVAKNHAEKAGCASVTLNVWCCNPGAVKFYESLGLKPQKIGMEEVL